MRQLFNRDGIFRLIPLLFVIAVNMSVYYMPMAWNPTRVCTDVTTAADAWFPFRPDWVVIYVAAFAFWVIAYIRIGAISDEVCCRFSAGEMIGKLICGAIFIIFPSTNIRPVFIPQTWTEELMAFIYRADGPYNLFPSIHCYISWMCFLGAIVYGRKHFSRAYKIFSGVMAVAICLSTLFTKQHAFVDMVGGILLAQITFFIGMRTRAYTVPQGLRDRLFGWIRKREISGGENEAD